MTGFYSQYNNVCLFIMMWKLIVVMTLGFSSKAFHQNYNARGVRVCVGVPSGLCSRPTWVYSNASSNDNKSDDDNDDVGVTMTPQPPLDDTKYRLTLPIGGGVGGGGGGLGAVEVSRRRRRLGMSLRQVTSPRLLSSTALDLDTLTMRIVSGAGGGGRTTASSQEEEVLASVDESFEGVVVWDVDEGNGLAWEAGIRAGDALLATSATLGDKIWPKKTLEGVQSSIRSRSIMSSEMTFEFRRARSYVEKTEVTETFEMTLPRPMGIRVEDVNGRVEIVDFDPERASKLTLDTLRVGDRIVAVDAALGGKLWPVSSAEALSVACTARVMGQPVKLRFERPVPVGKYRFDDNDLDVDGNGNTTKEMGQTPTSPSLKVGGAQTGTKTRNQGEQEAEIKAASRGLSGAVDGLRGMADQTNPSVAKVLPIRNSNTHKLLLSRARDLLQRYGDKSTSSSSSSTDDNKNSALKDLPVAVADRVMDALADAGAPLDARTLASVMNAYISRRASDRAMWAFEVATGLSANASDDVGGKTSSSSVQTHGALTPNPAALDLYTATSLLRAHALVGDYRAAMSVLEALEGTSPSVTESNSQWSLRLNGGPDVRCYNVVMAAAAKAGGSEAIDVAIQIFDRLRDPPRPRSRQTNNNNDLAKTVDDIVYGTVSSSSSPLNVQPTKNVVSYNTMIGAFAKEGRQQDALTIFYTMRERGVRPDKYSYTSLLKALVEGRDDLGAKELLSEMVEVGIRPDIFTYNTMIRGLCERGQWYRARDLVVEMETVRKIRPDALTYNLLMSGLLRADKPSAALTLFEAARADPRTSAVTESVKLYTTAITAASRIGNHGRAVELVADMKALGIRPNLRTLTALMSACMRSKQDHLAIDVYRQVLARQERRGRTNNNNDATTTSKARKENDNDIKDVGPDNLVLTMAVRAFCNLNDFTNAAEILTEQKDGRQKMNGRDIMFCYDYFLGKALKGRNYDVAERTMDELLGSGYIPSGFMFETIVEALDLISEGSNGNDMFSQRLEKLDFLLFILDSIHGRKLPCSGSFYAAVLDQCLRCGSVGRWIASAMKRSRTTTMNMFTQQHQGQHVDTNIDFNVNSSKDHDHQVTRADSPTWQGTLQRLLHDDNSSSIRNSDGNMAPVLQREVPSIHVQMNKKSTRRVIMAEGRIGDLNEPRQRKRRKTAPDAAIG